MKTNIKPKKLELDWQGTAEIYIERYEIMKEKSFRLYSLLLATISLLVFDWVLLLSFLLN
jgi:hypothetical protein